jgi:RNA polymerase sigma factor (sigma-70 family)
MIPLATREEQATACLEAAEKHQVLLLRVARHLAGNDEDGMELYQQALLNCHDAIRRNDNGFTGDRYEFYLLASIKNLYFKETKKKRRFTEFKPEEAETISPAGPSSDALGQLAEQVMAEVKAKFSPADRLALRLHVDGYSCQEIAELTGTPGEQARKWIWRKLDNMKAALRETFKEHWESLGE